MSMENEHWNICGYVSAVNSILGSILAEVCLCTLTAISVDRLLALLLGLRYQQVVTLKRTYVIVITFWVMNAAFSAVLFRNFLITSYYGTIVVSLCLVTSIFSHTKIFLNLRHHQRPRSTTEPSKSTEHRTIQKASVNCNMAATVAGGLLFIE